MKDLFYKFKYLMILIPLGIFIGLLDDSIIQGFLATDQTADHYQFIGLLIVGVVVLLFAVLRFDKNSNS